MLPENGTHQIAFDPAGHFVVTTTVGPFVQSAPDRVEPLPRWPGGDAFAIRFEPDGTLLVGHGDRLLRRDAGGTDFEDVGQDFGGTVTALVRDGKGTLWLRAGARLWARLSGAGTFEDRTDAYLGTPPGPYPRRLGVGADGTLLIPSTNGLIQVDDAGARVLPLDLPLDAMSLRDVWVDREGAVWVAGTGLHRTMGRGLWHTARTVDGLPSNAVWGMLRATDGTLYVATETGAARSTAGGFERLPGIEMAGYVTEGPPGTLWFAGDGKIVRYETATRATHVLGGETGLPPLAIVSAVVDRRAQLWVAVDSGGVYRAPLAGLLGAAPSRFERVALPSGDPSEMVTKILVDDDRVWLATSHGLYVDTGHEVRRFTNADGLRSDAPSLLVRHGGELCISYVGRSELGCFVYRNGSLDGLHHRETPGKLAPELLGEDAKGRLWIGTTRGVTVLDGDRVEELTRGDGAPGDDVNFDTFYAERDGTVWIGSSSGLGRFDGTAYEGPPPPPTVTLVSGDLAGRPVGLDQSTFGASVAYESALTMRLAVLSTIDERRIELEVKLLGYDEAWHPAESHVAAYQKLPGGHYRFAARARRPLGNWGPVRTFDFDVQVAFWQRWWFRALVGLGAVLVVAQITRYRARALRRENEHLESIVARRTSELEQKNVGARRILDAVEQGLFSVTAEGMIEPEISAAACRWFGTPAAGQRVWEWLPSGDPNANRWLALGWSTYGEGIMPKEVVFDQLPRRFTGAGRIYALDWLPNETSDGALVVATDITETAALERAERIQRETMDSLRRLHEDRGGYLEFLQEGERMLRALCEGALDPVSEARLVHTLKGNSAIFALGSFAEACHELEARAERGPVTPEDRAALREQWTAATRHLLPFVDLEDSVRVTHAELTAVLAAVARGVDRSELATLIRRLQFEPTRPRLERIAQQAQRVAGALGKGSLAIVIEDNGLRLPRAPWRPLWSSLVHLIRNAVDHGVEPERERHAVGKNATAQLRLETRITDGELVIAITDDGRGMDWGKIAEAARARQLPAATHDDLVAALFVDGLTTVGVATAFSGRGVGMAAVREATEALGGHVHVRSTRGVGTCFELRFPARVVDDELAPRRAAAA